MGWKKMSIGKARTFNIKDLKLSGGAYPKNKYFSIVGIIVTVILGMFAFSHLGEIFGVLNKVLDAIKAATAGMF